MTKYVVKNERGEYAAWSPRRRYYWTTSKTERGENDSRADAFRRARLCGGKVYRVRRLTAKRARERERQDVLRLLDVLLKEPGSDAGDALTTAREYIEAGEHRKLR